MTGSDLNLCVPLRYKESLSSRVSFVHSMSYFSTRTNRSAFSPTSTYFLDTRQRVQEVFAKSEGIPENEILAHYNDNGTLRTREAFWCSVTPVRNATHGSTPILDMPSDSESIVARSKQLTKAE